jgi:Glutathione S-transferase
MAGTHRLLGCKGCGNAIVEAAFALAGVPLETEEVDYSSASPTRERLLAVNPLGQVPALVLPDGRVLTESLAILHYLDDLEPGARLIPPPGDPTRAAFYRWSVFLVAAVYPTFTYGDDPRKWVADEAGAKLLRESTDRHREALWQQVETAAGSPVVPRRAVERPRPLPRGHDALAARHPLVREAHAQAPAIAKRAAALDAVAPVIARNFS